MKQKSLQFFFLLLFEIVYNLQSPVDAYLISCHGRKSFAGKLLNQAIDPRQIRSIPSYQKIRVDPISSKTLQMRKRSEEHDNDIIEGSNEHNDAIKISKDIKKDERTTRKNNDESSLQQSVLIRSILSTFRRMFMVPFPTLRLLDSKSSDRTNSRNGNFYSVKECILAIFGYIAIGGFAYTHFFERQWTFIDSLYFSMVSFSTVGYGDLCPTNGLSKLFTCIFGLGGVAILGVAITTIGSSIVQAEIEAVQNAQRNSQKRILSIFEGMPQILSRNENETSVDEISSQQQQDPSSTFPEHHNPKIQPIRKKILAWRGLLVKTLKSVIPSMSLMILGGSVMGRLEGWNWMTSIYYSMITAFTLGYGDYAPSTQMGRLWALFLIPVGVATAGELLGNVANILVERRQSSWNEQLLSRKLDTAYLTEMDKSLDGKVTKLEYMQFMLLEMGIVEKPLLEELDTQFQRLDVCGDGILWSADLEMMAKLEEER